MATHYQAWLESKRKLDAHRTAIRKPTTANDMLRALKRERDMAENNLRTMTLLQELAQKNLSRFGTGSLMVGAGIDSISQTSARIAELDRQIATMEAICASPDAHTN